MFIGILSRNTWYAYKFKIAVDNDKYYIFCVFVLSFSVACGIIFHMIMGK